MKLVDVHCHLESDEFTDLDAVIADAQQAGVVKMITSSIVPAKWAVSRSLAQRYASVEFAWGIHPWYIEPAFERELDGLGEAHACGAVAIGEIGLDTKTEKVPLDVQLAFFERQLQIAKDIDLPVVVHCRGAFGDLTRVVKKLALPRAAASCTTSRAALNWPRSWPGSVSAFRSAAR